MLVMGGAYFGVRARTDEAGNRTNKACCLHARPRIRTNQSRRAGDHKRVFLVRWRESRDRSAILRKRVQGRHPVEQKSTKNCE